MSINLNEPEMEYGAPKTALGVGMMPYRLSDKHARSIAARSGELRKEFGNRFYYALAGAFYLALTLLFVWVDFHMIHEIKTGPYEFQGQRALSPSLATALFWGALQLLVLAKIWHFFFEQEETARKRLTLRATWMAFVTIIGFAGAAAIQRLPKELARLEASQSQTAANIDFGTATGPIATGAQSFIASLSDTSIELIYALYPVFLIMQYVGFIVLPIACALTFYMAWRYASKFRDAGEWKTFKPQKDKILEKDKKLARLEAQFEEVADDPEAAVRREFDDLMETARENQRDQIRQLEEHEARLSDNPPRPARDDAELARRRYQRELREVQDRKTRAINALESMRPELVNAHFASWKTRTKLN